MSLPTGEAICEAQCRLKRRFRAGGSVRCANLHLGLLRVDTCGVAKMIEAERQCWVNYWNFLIWWKIDMGFAICKDVLFNINTRETGH